MASAFSHAFVAVTFGKLTRYPSPPPRFWVLGMVCSILPDADVISFLLGIRYGDFFGHRGFTHSFCFAFLLAALFTQGFFRDQDKVLRKKVFWYFFWCTASHPFLDALTNGGLGVAFFSPLDNTRYFLPWRPILVSPIGVESFFSEWGYQVILSELVWVFLPCVVILVFSTLFFRLFSKKT